MKIRTRLAKYNAEALMMTKPECACELSHEENWRDAWVPICRHYVASLIRGKKSGPAREICHFCCHDKECHHLGMEG